LDQTKKPRNASWKQNATKTPESLWACRFFWLSVITPQEKLKFEVKDGPKVASILATNTLKHSRMPPKMRALDSSSNRDHLRPSRNNACILWLPDSAIRQRRTAGSTSGH
jgi:hypothetical protein